MKGGDEGLFKILSLSKAFGRLYPELKEKLEENGAEVEMYPMEQDISEDELAAKIHGYHGLTVGMELVTEKVLSQAAHLKIVAKHGVGVDNIDLESATKKGIYVTNAPGSNDDAVADYTFGLMLAVCRQIPLADRSTRQGQWPRLFGHELWKKKLGIVGLGSIGKKVAQRARGFSMELLGYDEFKDEEFAEKTGLKYVSLEELLKESDFVTLHLPYTEKTRYLLEAKELSMMKPSAYLINAARGMIVEEEALARAVSEQQIAGAAVDVFAEEPVAPGHPFFELDNIVVTPHIGAYSHEAVKAMGTAVMENILAVMKKSEPPDLVNRNVLNNK